MNASRLSILLVAILVVAAFLSGTVLAKEAPRHAVGIAPLAVTAGQWAAISGAQKFLLADDSNDLLYLPLIRR